ncbi:MAG: FIST C-terminal domain-containing protein [Alphaproteobacteria bacterium]|nr:FIST C-terminal domain-containing protein [Alphaproteobacteria bacterium]
MSGFRAGAATGRDGMAAVAAAWARLGPMPRGANLGFLYLSEAAAGAFPDALAWLQRASGVAAWIGGVGLGVVGDGLEAVDAPAASLMMAALPEDGFRTFRLRDPAAATLPGDGRGWLVQANPALALVHGDPRDQALPALLESVAAGSGAFLVGGLMATAAPAVHCAGAPQVGGVSGALFGAAVAVATGLTQGCRPIGPHRRVTAADGNVVVSLDGRPALEALLEDIGPALAADLRRAAGRVHVAFPVAGSDRADYLVRNLMAIDPERGWVAVGEAVAAGDTLFFCARDRDSATRDLERMLADLKRRGGEGARGAVYCSCIARGPNLFGPDAAEMAAIRAALGPVPIAGFFANGEIFHTRLYGYTGILTLFL